MAAHEVAAAGRSRLARGVIAAVALAVAVLFGLAVFSDAAELAAALRSFPVPALVLALALATANHWIRFARWQYYLRALHVTAPFVASAEVFFSGLAMTITPGKVGELVKCLMLRERTGAPIALTAPVVIAERFTDLLAVLFLASWGVFTLSTAWPVFAVGVAVTLGLFAVITFSPELVDGIGRRLSRIVLKDGAVEWASESASALRGLLAGGRLVVGSGLAVASWLAECVAFWVVLQALDADVTLFGATVVYAVGTLAGALSMLPGGLGATEVTMVGLLTASGVPVAAASAATLIIRACTLWWGELVGLGAYVLHLAAVRRGTSASTTANGE